MRSKDLLGCWACNNFSIESKDEGAGAHLIHGLRVEVEGHIRGSDG